jgi:hypothetical protein
VRYFRDVQPEPRLTDPTLDASLERDGYAVIDDFLDRAEIVQLLDVFRTHDSPIHRHPFSASILSDDLAYRSAVDREIKAVLRPKVDVTFNGYRHCFSNFVVKEPLPANAAANAGEVMLHQDIAFVDESRFQSLGIWCPLVDADPVNGCLSVVPGSHRFNRGPRGPGTPHPYRELDPSFAPQLRAVPMKAGSAMIFCQKLFHASRPNRGTAARVAVGCLFVPQDAQLYCYYPDPAAPQRMEVFEVDDLFYTRHLYRTRPEGVPRVAVIDYWYETIDRTRLAG